MPRTNGSADIHQHPQLQIVRLARWQVMHTYNDESAQTCTDLNSSLKSSCDMQMKMATRSDAAGATKGCSRCRQTKFASDFNLNHTTSSGLTSHCKDCIAAAAAERKKRKPLVTQPTVDFKVCGRCRSRKHANEFHRTQTRSDGLSSSCKVCRNHANSASRAALGNMRRHSYAMASAERADCSTRMTSVRMRLKSNYGKIATKVCTDCQASLPVDNFLDDARKLDGLRDSCQTCRTAEMGSHRTPSGGPEATGGTKKCRKCGLERATTAFHRQLSRPDGLYSYCVFCASEYKLKRKMLRAEAAIRSNAAAVAAAAAAAAADTTPQEANSIVLPSKRLQLLPRRCVTLSAAVAAKRRTQMSAPIDDQAAAREWKAPQAGGRGTAHRTCHESGSAAKPVQHEASQNTRCNTNDSEVSSAPVSPALADMCCHMLLDDGSAHGPRDMSGCHERSRAACSIGHKRYGHPGGQASSFERPGKSACRADEGPEADSQRQQKRPKLQQRLRPPLWQTSSKDTLRPFPIVQTPFSFQPSGSFHTSSSKDDNINLTTRQHLAQKAFAAQLAEVASAVGLPPLLMGAAKGNIALPSLHRVDDGLLSARELCGRSRSPKIEGTSETSGLQDAPLEAATARKEVTVSGIEPVSPAAPGTACAAYIKSPTSVNKSTGMDDSWGKSDLTNRDPVGRSPTSSSDLSSTSHCNAFAQVLLQDPSTFWSNCASTSSPSFAAASCLQKGSWHGAACVPVRSGSSSSVLTALPAQPHAYCSGANSLPRAAALLQPFSQGATRADSSLLHTGVAASCFGAGVSPRTKADAVQSLAVTISPAEALCGVAGTAPRLLIAQLDPRGVANSTILNSQPLNGL